MSSYDKYNGVELGTDASAVGIAESVDDFIEESDYQRAKHRQFERSRKSSHSAAITNTGGDEGIGRFVIPKAHQDHLQGKARINHYDHLQAVQDRHNQIGFSGRYYPLFDGKIQEYLLDDPGRHAAISNPSSSRYADLKTNIAVVRNALYTQFFPDGEYNANDPRDAAKRAMIEEMGEKLGSALKWEARRQLAWSILTFPIKLVTGQLFGSGNDDVSVLRFGKYGQVPEGAAKMYELLLKKQNAVSWNPINWIRGKKNQINWGLLPKEQSPFSSVDVDEAIYVEARNKQTGKESPGAFLTAEGFMLEKNAAQLKHVQDMQPKDVGRSVMLAHEILDNLKKIQMGREGFALDSPEAQRRDLDEGRMLVQLSTAYTDIMAGLAKQNKAALNDPIFEQARIALGKLGHITMVNAMAAYAEEMEGGAGMRELNTAMKELPNEFQYVKGERVSDLIAKVQNAMEYAAAYQGYRQDRKEAQAMRQNRAVMHELDAIKNNIDSTMSSVALRISSVSTNEHLDLHKAAQEINRENATGRSPGSGIANALGIGGRSAF